MSGAKRKQGQKPSSLKKTMTTEPVHPGDNEEHCVLSPTEFQSHKSFPVLKLTELGHIGPHY